MKNKSFVIFPKDKNDYKSDKRKLWVNIVVFDVLNTKARNFSELSNTYLFLDGDFISDDAMSRPKLQTELKDITIDDLLKGEMENQMYETLYFPNLNCDYILDGEIDKWISCPLLSCTLVGWSDSCYTKQDDNSLWYCTFNDLNDDGKNMYYLMKKLFNNKEVRILTFIEKENF